MEFFAEEHPSENEVTLLRMKTISYDSFSPTVTIVNAQPGDYWLSDKEQEELDDKQKNTILLTK